MTQIYEVITGRIIRKVWCPDPVAQLSVGEAVWDAGDIDGAAEYIDGGIVMVRPELPISDTYEVTDGLTLDLPEGTRIKCEGVKVTADDQPTDLTFPEPGEYSVLIRPPFPIREKTIAVTVSG